MKEADQAIRVGAITIVPDTYEVRVGAARKSLTAGEYRLLWALARQRGRVVPLTALGGPFDPAHEPPAARTIRARVVAVRRKLGPAARQLENVRGCGYRLNE